MSDAITAACAGVADDTAILALEQIAARSWPAPDHERLGPWLVRAGGGWTGRANSALPLDPAADLAAWLPAIEAWTANAHCRRSSPCRRRPSRPWHRCCTSVAGGPATAAT